MDETQRMLGILNGTFPDLAAMAPADARFAADARIRPAANLDDVASAEDRILDAGAHRLRVRTYRPHQPEPGAAVTVFAHGGGFLHGSVDGHDGFCRRWAKGIGGVVVSVETRLTLDAAPPAGRDDVVTAAEWAVGEGLADNGILLAGDSSGGNLASGAAIVLRDRGDSPVIGQALLYPFLDPSMSTNSHRTRATGFFVTGRLLAYYWRTYLTDAEGVADCDITPLAVDDLTGLPPTIIVTAGLDPLCDEGTLYAERLGEAGTRVILRHHPDQFHGFLTIPDYGPATSAADVLWSDIRSISNNPRRTGNDNS